VTITGSLFFDIFYFKNQIRKQYVFELIRIESLSNNFVKNVRFGLYCNRVNMFKFEIFSEIFIKCKQITNDFSRRFIDNLTIRLCGNGFAGLDECNFIDFDCKFLPRMSIVDGQCIDKSDRHSFD